MVIATDVLTHPLVYARLRSALVKEGYTVFLSRSGNPFRSLYEHARVLGRRLEGWQLQNAILIGHGLGSLCALALSDPARRRIRQFVSLGAPFHGSRVYLPLSVLPAFRDMAVGSEYLLLNRVNALLFPVITPFSAWRNEWIAPANLAHFGQARDLILDQVGHYNLVLGKENLATVVDYLNQTVDGKPTASPAAATEARNGPGGAPKATAAAGARRNQSRGGRAKKPAGRGRKR